MITRGPSLTEQVRQHLKQQILDDTFEDGRIPSETELAAELGVSRTTVRDALSRLEHEGAVVRRQGAGTFVNPPGLRIKTRLEEMWSYEQMLRDHGYEPSVKVVETRVEEADPETAAALGTEVAAPLSVIEKVFFENSEPVVLTENFVSLDLIGDPPSSTEAAAPMFEFLEKRTGSPLAYYVSEIVPVVLDARRASLLGAAGGSPAISFEETGFGSDGEAMVHARSVFRDDLLRLRVMRRRAG